MPSEKISRRWAFRHLSNKPYSGKKKRHTLKTQLLVSLLTGEIIALAFSNGKKHDFQLFKDSGIHVKAETVLEADTGYQGLAQIHANSLLPVKRSKHHPLTKQERKENREISRKRIFVEHAIRFLKRFRILSERYLLLTKGNRKLIT